MSENIEIIHEFSTEVRELLEQLEPSILELEKVCNEELSQDSPEITEALNNIFRLFHSVKGSSGFLQLNNITETAHVAESLLDRLRSSTLKIIPGYIDLLCDACDFTHEALDYLDKHLDDEGMEEKAQGLIETFQKILSGETLPPTLAAEEDKEREKKDKEDEQKPLIDLDQEPDNLKNPKVVEFFIQEAYEQLQIIEQDLLDWIKAPDDKELMNKLFGNIHSFKGNCGFMNLSDPERLSHSMETLLEGVINGLEVDRSEVADLMLSHLTAFREVLDDIADGGQGRIAGIEERLAPINEFIPLHDVEDGKADESKPKLGEILVEEGIVSPEELKSALETQQNKKPLVKKQDIRVNLEKLDTLITLIGELVIAENMLINNPDLAGMELENFSRSAQQMNKLVNELQEMATSIRLIPVAGVFSRMNRLIHDLGRKSSKKIDLKIIGESTEMDKSVIENVVDPLTHLIRNAVDHGLESPEERLAAGKPETGVIRLSASHEEGDVMILIQDDGRGINREKIIATAQKRGLIEGESSQLTDRQVHNLLFRPGFSTADKITEVSGRGVGMDVVLQNLKNIRGNVQMKSKPGEGTTVMLRIPLTMSIIDGMMVRVGKSFFIVPILSIRESICPAADSITITPDGHELVRIRERLYPVIRLHTAYDLNPDNYDLDKGILIVVEAQGRNVCLFVDEIVGQQQTVIKGLSDFIVKTGNVKGVSGCTILGDGSVCLILDTHALVDMDRTAEIQEL
ncbi:MAG: chemotaxis protein CheA [Deltaproteobacteria bacterium]|nr:MAG: chemotaxis protein CheA [Deltaproteobacteria bacterium]